MPHPIETAAHRRLEHYRLYERNWVPGQQSPQTARSLTGNQQQSSGASPGNPMGHLFPEHNIFPEPGLYPH